jgi:hypothetical protein
MFVVDRNKELVGFSHWLWDNLYAPVVGCFERGRLVTVATCNREPQRVPLSGPRHRHWFRMRVKGELREAIETGDSSVVLLRLEDGAPIRQADRPVADMPFLRVEDLMSRVSRQPHGALDGFPAFIKAPVRHQLDVVFLDYLNRLPDPQARDHYLAQMDLGMSILEVREHVMRGEEFWARGLTVSDAPGSLISSPMWKSLAAAEPLGLVRPNVRQIRVSAYAELSDEDFVRAAHRDCHGDEPSQDGIVGLSEATREHGRGFVASLLVRDAANGGIFYEFIDD